MRWSFRSASIRWTSDSMLVRGLKMNDHPVPFNSGVERRLAIRELSAKTERVTVMLDCSKHVLHHEDSGGTTQ